MKQPSAKESSEMLSSEITEIQEEANERVSQIDAMPMKSFDQYLQEAQAYLKKWGKKGVNSDQIKELYELDRQGAVINWFEVTAEARLDEAMEGVNKLLSVCPENLRERIKKNLPIEEEFKKLLKRTEKQLELIYKVYEEPHVQLMCLEIPAEIYVEALNKHKTMRKDQGDVCLDSFAEIIMRREDRADQELVKQGKLFKANIIDRAKSTKVLHVEDINESKEKRLEDLSKSEFVTHNMLGTGMKEFSLLMLTEHRPNNVIDDYYSYDGTCTMLNKKYVKGDKLLVVGDWNNLNLCRMVRLVAGNVSPRGMLSNNTGDPQKTRVRLSCDG